MSFAPGCSLATGQELKTTETCETLGTSESTLLQADFHVSHSASRAGQRRGKDDNRYLWPEMLRVVKESQPTWVLAENVPGIIDLALDQVLSDLETIGYETGTLVIPACAVGAPHRRDRVWIVAHSESEGLEGSIATGRARPARCSAQRSNLDVSDTYSKQAIRTTNPWEEHRNWPAEPDVGRVAHGIPYRVDRLRSLGNAIVPQVAEVILRQMI